MSYSMISLLFVPQKRQTSMMSNSLTVLIAASQVKSPSFGD